MKTRNIDMLLHLSTVNVQNTTLVTIPKFNNLETTSLYKDCHEVVKHTAVIPVKCLFDITLNASIKYHLPKELHPLHSINLNGGWQSTRRNPSSSLDKGMC